MHSQIVIDTGLFNEQATLERLKHYLPSQAPLKDFVHHNTLHAFQNRTFFEALPEASRIFGYKVFLPLEEYRKMFKEGKISEQILYNAAARNGKEYSSCSDQLFHSHYEAGLTSQCGTLRSKWREHYQIDIEAAVNSTFFRVIGSYLNQGIAINEFPVKEDGFLSSVINLEKNSGISLFRSERARKLLFEPGITIKNLLEILAGDEHLFEQYLFDQQFSHPGWSGIIAETETNPGYLLEKRPVTLRECIVFELLLEIDAIDTRLKSTEWKNLSELDVKGFEPPPLPKKEYTETVKIWQEAFEFSYYDPLLSAISNCDKPAPPEMEFQAFFCIDDREASLRYYLEQEGSFETFGTPGFFGVEFYYKPSQSAYYTKLCPAPVTPKHLIIEKSNTVTNRKTELHFTAHSHHVVRGWLLSQTFGFFSVFKLMLNLFRPSESPATASSFAHVNKDSKLSVSNSNETENSLRIGFTISEMTDRVETVLRSTGLLENFSKLIYMVAHGASSTNNPHFAAYDCGACCGRPGSVNARVFCEMANNSEVRKELNNRNITIPDETFFIAALHDTTRDEIEFYNEPDHRHPLYEHHSKAKNAFLRALQYNAKERSRRLELVDTKKSLRSIHEKMKRRSISLFEPRPELNHATNASCIVGRRSLTANVFLDRRTFLNSYDYRTDVNGEFLLKILNAATPVCGGINLEYYFSRVDPQKLGAGSKLPHNVMGLIAVANGIEGDLRPGLPPQMTELHDPVRLLMVVEHFPEVVLEVIRKNSETWEWYKNEWINLVAIHPESRELFLLRDQKWQRYHPVNSPRFSNDIQSLIENSQQNINPLIIKK